jgi:hypothetical protein
LRRQRSADATPQQNQPIPYFFGDRKTMRKRHIHRRVLGAVAAGVIVMGSLTALALGDSSSGDMSAMPAAPTIKRVPARIAAEFPALTKAIGADEAQQLPAVARVMGTLAREGNAAGQGGANSALARRVSQDGENAEYVVPGNEVVCLVAISVGHATGGGCAPAPSVEAKGTTSLTVVPGGYEVSGILPTGTADVTITASNGSATVVDANANHAFEFYSAVPLAKLVYSLPGGGEHEGSLELPPPAHAPSSAG